MTPSTASPNAPVHVREVGLRTGLQSIARTPPTVHKLESNREAHAAGRREIEVGSFVPAWLLPQPADTAKLAAFAKSLPGLTTSVLDAGVDRFGLADTVGYADPLMVSRLFERARTLAGERLACGHLHDTCGLDLANGFAAWLNGETLHGSVWRAGPPKTLLAATRGDA